MKDIKALTFRPICDSMKYVLNLPSLALLTLLRTLKDRIFDKFPSLNIIFPKSGQHYAQSISELDRFPCRKRPYHIFFSADLGDAYTNCKLEHLKSSYLFLASIIEEPGWRQELVIQLATLILCNNFIEAGCKYYLTGPVLPMGNSCSGEALNIIALAGELVYIINPPLSPYSLALMPSYISKISKRFDCSSYARYVDDTFIILNATSVQHIISLIKDICSHIFPPSIPISLELSTFFSTFLDTCTFPHFASRKFSHFMRLNFEAPSKIPNPLSNIPLAFQHLLAISNSIRALRICLIN